MVSDIAGVILALICIVFAIAGIALMGMFLYGLFCVMFLDPPRSAEERARRNLPRRWWLFDLTRKEGWSPETEEHPPSETKSMTPRKVGPSTEQHAKKADSDWEMLIPLLMFLSPWIVIAILAAIVRM